MKGSLGSGGNPQAGAWLAPEPVLCLLRAPISPPVRVLNHSSALPAPANLALSFPSLSDSACQPACQAQGPAVPFPRLSCVLPLPVISDPQDFVALAGSSMPLGWEESRLGKSFSHPLSSGLSLSRIPFFHPSYAKDMVSPVLRVLLNWEHAAQVCVCVGGGGWQGGRTSFRPGAQDSVQCRSAVLRR